MLFVYNLLTLNSHFGLTKVEDIVGTGTSLEVLFDE
jgi:hypothetical protein